MRDGLVLTLWGRRGRVGGGRVGGGRVGGGRVGGGRWEIGGSL